MKKLLLLLCLLLTSVYSMAYDFVEDGICYEIISSSDVKITSVLDYSKNITIPEIATHRWTDDEGQVHSVPYNVTSIGDKAFYHMMLTSITIPESVTEIGYCAFEGCKDLTKAEFASIESLCRMQFDGAPSNPLSYAHHLYIDGKEIKDLVIPNNVPNIGNYAFYGCCIGLTSVTIGNSVTSIGDYAFYNCYEVTTVTIGNSVTTIGTNAFATCYGLTSVTIPNSVNSIGGGAFFGCSSLTSVTIPNSVTSIDASTFKGCSSLTSVTIPNRVTSIGYCAFCACSSLTSITIPNSVIDIDTHAFEHCSSLTSVVIPNRVTRIGEGTFLGCI